MLMFTYKSLEKNNMLMCTYKLLEKNNFLGFTLELDMHITFATVCTVINNQSIDFLLLYFILQH
jgi:hypothetical protein